MENLQIPSGTGFATPPRMKAGKIRCFIAGNSRSRGLRERHPKYRFSPGFLSNKRFDNVHTTKCEYRRRLLNDSYTRSLGNPVKVGLCINSGNNICCRDWLVLRDIIVNFPHPSLSFSSPVYFCHVRIRCSISSLEIILPWRESAKPRSTMREKASSRRISSKLLSSGCA